MYVLCFFFLFFVEIVGRLVFDGAAFWTLDLEMRVLEEDWRVDLLLVDLLLLEGLVLRGLRDGAMFVCVCVLMFCV